MKPDKPKRSKDCGILTVGFAVAMLFMMGGVQSAYAITGAIFTTDSTGSVNVNIYEFKGDVYLNGGPPANATCTAAALPDGNYYFQVTNPSGTLLLSTDSIFDRQVAISGGVITGVSGAGSHATIAGQCPGSKAVQLIPFADTDNPGGVYKVWMTLVSDYVTPDATNTFGFVSSKSKTDNFKIKFPKGPCQDPSNCDPLFPTITGTKFYDSDLNGTQGAGEVGIQGWRINCNSPNCAPNPDYTSAAGLYSFILPTGASGTYGISEQFPNASWLPTTPTSGNVVVNANTNFAGPNFGNVCVGAAGGLTLGFWSNKNGMAKETASNLCTLNDLNLRNGNGSDFNPILGCPAPTNSQISAGKTNLSNWLLSANAVNMANMLSAQLAAMKLNVLNYSTSPAFGVNGTSLVYAGPLPATCSALTLLVNSNGWVAPNALGFIGVNNLMTDANLALGLYTNTTGAGNPRDCQQYLKNALDAANNNKNFLQPGPDSCPYTTPY